MNRRFGDRPGMGSSIGRPEGLHYYCVRVHPLVVQAFRPVVGIAVALVVQAFRPVFGIAVVLVVQAFRPVFVIGPGLSFATPSSRHVPPTTAASRRRFVRWLSTIFRN